VAYSELFHKLHSFGITGLPLNGLKRFSIVDHSESLSRIIVHPGQRSLVSVAEGSVLGSTLCILFINDTSNITVNGVFIKLFADNLKLFTSLISTDDSHNLQDALSQSCCVIY